MLAPMPYICSCGSSPTLWYEKADAYEKRNARLLCENCGNYVELKNLPYACRCYGMTEAADTASELITLWNEKIEKGWKDAL